MERNFWVEWFVSMRTIILLVLFLPWVVTLVFGWRYGFLGTPLAFFIGFPIDWYRLQRRNRR